MKNLYKVSLIVLMQVVALKSFSQVLFTYGSKSVTRDAFVEAYKKNNAGLPMDEKNLRIYLDLYIRFKLKVQAAYDLKMDTLPTQVAEVNNFRSQVADSYMMDESSLNKLVDEAMERSKKDLELAHIFLSIKPGMTEAQQKEIQKKAQLIYEKASKGADFGQLAASFSDDELAKTRKGYIGYITALNLPYEIETLAYATKPGTVSKPYRSKAGIHIIKVMKSRPAIGKVSVSQILIAFPPDPSAAQKAKAKKLADSLYVLLKKGADFKNLAKNYSGDNLSYENGGQIPDFGIGKYDASFEAAAFGLKAPGEISKPVLTAYGYHILKLNKRVPLQADLNNPNDKELFRQYVAADNRISIASNILLNKIFALTDFKKANFNSALFNMITDSVWAASTYTQAPELNDATTLFSYKGKNVTLKDWLNYIEVIRNFENMRGAKTNEAQLDQFIQNTTFEYYREHLEEFNPQFAAQIKEFAEGNLLFEVMQKQVWEAAAADSVGLQDYFQKNRDKYWWEASADALIFSANNQNTFEQTSAALQADPNSWKKMLEMANGTLQGDSGRFELGQIPVVERTRFSEKLITAPVMNEQDKTLTFAYIIKVYPNREPRKFEDAKGLVINDYQQILEEKWVNSLRAKYPVKVSDAEFKQLLNKN
ncbi:MULTISPECIES: peptidylprolyl isomerase [unclassified Paraflavitalea]|uniref:peptidylprolyl isomerase n=1 Tax=unclassified Paraflavitalea TaxID=2798305 RepID=UPI003D351E69